MSERYYGMAETRGKRMKIEIELNNLTAEEQEIVKRLAKKKAYWTPNIGEHYWYLRDIGDIFITENNETGIDEFRISIGNCFKTEKQAKEAITKIRMQIKWKQMSLEAGESDNPWDGTHVHWTVYFEDGALHYLDHSCMICAATHFPSIESLKSAIAELGEQNVKKYILGVEE